MVHLLLIFASSTAWPSAAWREHKTLLLLRRLCDPFSCTLIRSLDDSPRWRWEGKRTEFSRRAVSAGPDCSDRQNGLVKQASSGIIAQHLPSRPAIPSVTLFIDESTFQGGLVVEDAGAAAI